MTQFGVWWENGAAATDRAASREAMEKWTLGSYGPTDKQRYTENYIFYMSNGKYVTLGYI